MKPEALKQGLVQRPAQSRPQAASQGWLAALERAFLQEWPAAPAGGTGAENLAPSFGQSDASRRDTVQSEGEPAPASLSPRAAKRTRGADGVGGPPSAVAASRAVRTGRVLPQADVSAPALVQRAEGRPAVAATLPAPLGVAAAATAPWQGLGSAHPGADGQGVTTVHSEGTAGRATANDLHDGGAELRPASGDEPSCTGEALTRQPPARYAKRLLQVAGEQALRINLRDASLSPEQGARMAQALFAQIEHAHAPLSRIHVNGIAYMRERAMPNANPPAASSEVAQKEE